METLRLVRAQYPEIILCLASNGLGIGPYIKELKALNVGHVTITVNAIDDTVAANVYAWVRHGKKVLRAADGVKILLANQIEAIKNLIAEGITVKVNSIVIPGINDFHIIDIAKKMSELGVDIFNCLPYYPNEGSAFADIPEPSKKSINELRKEAGKYILQMTHCARCRADAVGCIGDKDNDFLMEKLQACSQMPDRPDNLLPESVLKQKQNTEETRNKIAIASMEGVLVNQHLGEASRLLIFTEDNKTIRFEGERDTPEPGCGDLRWEAMADLLKDCHTLLVSGIGSKPRQVLESSGIRVFVVEGIIEEAATAVFQGTSLNHIIKREQPACRHECSGNGMGCG
jgi:nitrogen fixation protein NifB